MSDLTKIGDAADWIDNAADSMRAIADQLRANVHGLDAQLETVTAERDKLLNERDTADKKLSDKCDELADTLHAVKYWLQDVLTLGKPAGDPRPLLRMIEWHLQDIGE